MNSLRIESLLETRERMNMSSKAGQAVCQAFVAGISLRLRRLARNSDLAWVSDDAPISVRNRSFMRCCRWIGTQRLAKFYPVSGNRVNVAMCDPKREAIGQLVEKEAREEPMWDLTKQGTELTLDLGAAIGEYYRRRKPWTAWVRECDRTSMNYNMPCVGWFNGNRNGKLAPFGLVALAIYEQYEVDRPFAIGIATAMSSLEGYLAKPGTHSAA